MKVNELIPSEEPKVTKEEIEEWKRQFKNEFLKMHTPWTKEVIPGRNDKCPCGSGKKYKNCCGRDHKTTYEWGEIPVK